MVNTSGDVFCNTAKSLFSAEYYIRMNAPFFTLCICTLLTLTLQQCKRADVRSAITGTTWQTDSIYDYYNGFGYMNRTPYPKEIFRYRKDSIATHEGMDRELLFYYSTTDTSIVLRDMQGNLVSDFKILQLTDKNMVLKKNRDFIFPGKNQERYEIRYFSKLDGQGN
ncbi:MAG: hypothetical protein KF862_15370 [Chitinophagaceae bacterium]|nr:hypothetical protein [Chitinophagaceae bacterium]